MLQDLDELVLKCRDERARAYIREAVACYKSGAYRASVVSTWVAVAFDVIDKIYDLSLAGDKQAIAFIQAYNGHLANNEIDKLLSIERELLLTAKDAFEFISAQEFADLERLREDRNRCAHPSRTSFPDVFSPPAELARLHIRTAVEHLLQHEPAQGKAALDELKTLINLSNFPKVADRAVVVLQASPLKRARLSLIRNLLVAALKASLDRNTEYGQTERLHATICAVKVMHAQAWRRTVTEELPRILRTVTDSSGIQRAVGLLLLDSELSDAMTEDVATLFEPLLRASANPSVAEDALSLPKLAGTAKAMITGFNAEEIGFLLGPAGQGRSPEVISRIADGYARAESFAEGNSWAALLRQVAELLQPEDVRTILCAAATSGQLFRNFKTAAVIANLREKGRIPNEEFDALATQIPE